jgi:transaldolase
MKNKINKNISIYADGANMKEILHLNKFSFIKGFTTNPTLMKQSGVKNYKKFAIDLLSKIKNKPISFEVFADDLKNMEIQAREIATWGKNINIKIPIINTKGKNTSKLIAKLANENIECNVTAIFTFKQLSSLMKIVGDKKIILSVFAGRIADTGVDPEIIIKKCSIFLKKYKKAKLLWASTREILNIFQAHRSGCQIITVPNNLIFKLNNLNKNLQLFSKETVKMFYNDAKLAGFKI